MSAMSDPLLRFVTDGLMATIDSYLAGALPLHRFTWELSARVDTLSSLDAPTRTLTRLRWLLRTVELVHTRVAGSGAAEVGAADPAGAGDPAAEDGAGAGACAGAVGDRAAGLPAEEASTLATALADFRAVLASLVPLNPLDPAGAARPATLAVVA